MSAIAEIRLTRGMVAIIDAADLPLVFPYYWYADRSRKTSQNWYARRSDGVRMSRLIMGISDDRIVDHIDGDGLNNRRSNLRIGTRAQNNVNRRFTSGKYLIGVKPKGRRWSAKTCVNGTDIHLGMFATEIEAHQAYLKTVVAMHGDWVPLAALYGTAKTNRESLDSLTTSEKVDVLPSGHLESPRARVVGSIPTGSALTESAESQPGSVPAPALSSHPSAGAPIPESEPVALLPIPIRSGGRDLDRKTRLPAGSPPMGDAVLSELAVRQSTSAAVSGMDASRSLNPIPSAHSSPPHADALSEPVVGLSGFDPGSLLSSSDDDIRAQPWKAVLDGLRSVGGRGH